MAAYYAVGMLQEEDWQSPSAWELPAGAAIEAVLCETENAVDDLQLRLAPAGRIFIQAKRSLSASRRVGSPLYKAVEQFVREYLTAKAEGRPLDPSTDRLILATSRLASRPMWIGVPLALERLRSDRRPVSEIRLTNDVERTGWGALLACARSAFAASGVSGVGDDDLAALLDLVRVEVLEVEGDGEHHRESLAALRREVLDRDAQVEQVWSYLVDLFLTAASRRLGLDRLALQRRLGSAGIPLQANPSVRVDVAKLGRATIGALERLRPHASLAGPGTGGRIVRACEEALLERARQGSLFVVGEPGIGKTGLMVGLAESLRDQGADVILLSIQDHAFADAGEFRRALDLGTDLVEILNGWPSNGARGFLLLDGLDAARGTGSATLADIVRRVPAAGGRWSVVASVRTFDLRHNRQLQDAMVHGKEGDAEYVRGEFRHIRHFEVPALGSSDLAQIASLSPALHRILERAPEDLRELARVPFNLDLLARLVQGGDDLSTLAPIATQLQLLNAYWQQRVRRPPDRRSSRDRSVGALCQAALGDMRLEVNRLDVSEPDGLEDLLREGVLTSRARGMDEFVAFAHNILFDYAFAAHVLDPSPEKFVAISRRPDVLLLARPSVVLRLVECFDSEISREPFWSLFSRTVDSSVESDPLPMVVAGVAAEVISRFEDLAPLLSTIQAADPAMAETICRHLAGALLSARDLARRLADVSDLGPWVAFVEALSTELRGGLEYPVRALIAGLLPERERLTPSDMRLLASAGRKLLAWALDAEPMPDAVISVGIEACGRTIAYAPRDTADLLRQVISSDRLSVHGYRELRLVAEQIPAIAQVDPILAADVYIAGFLHQENSEEPVSMGGRILPMRSNRRQDYGMGLYSLASHAPAFLACDPAQAVRALVVVARSAHRVPGKATRPEDRFTVRWRGRAVEIIEDGSRIWDIRPQSGDDAERIIEAFEKHLIALATKRSRTDLDAFLDALSAEELPAVMVRRVLGAALHAPRALAPRVADLLSEPAVLTSVDLNGPASTCLEPLFAVLSARDRGKIEEVILDLYEAPDPLTSRQGKRMLASLPPERIVTPSARQASVGLASEEGAEPAGAGVAVWSGDGQGLNAPHGKVETPSDRRVRRYTDTLARLMRGADGRPLDVSNKRLAAGIRAALRARQEGASAGVSERLLHEADARITEAAKRIAATWPLRPSSGPVRLSREIALVSAQHELPAGDLDHDDDDDLRSWGWPAVRRDAVEALVLLAREPRVVTDQVRTALRALARDPSAIVRDGLASTLNYLFFGDEGLAWELAERIAREESSSAVQRSMLSTTMGRLLHQDEDRAVALLEEMSRREHEGGRRSGLLAAIRQWFLGLYFHLDRDEGKALADKLIADPLAEGGVAAAHWAQLREPVCAGETGDRTSSRVRARTLAWQAAVVRKLASEIDEIVGSGGPGANEEQALRLKGLLELADRAATEAYFASGSYRADQEPALDPEVRRRFWIEASELLDALCLIGLPSAAHHVVELLGTFVEFDPKGVWRRLTKVLEVAASWGYQNESLAVGEFMKIIERYLASHRDVVLDEPSGRNALIKALVAFAQVGWPEPRRLLVGLDDMFR